MTTAFFIAAGKVPVDNDVFTIEVKAGREKNKFSIKSQVGRGSSVHDLFGDLRMILPTSVDLKSQSSGTGVELSVDKLEDGTSAIRV